MKLPPLYSVAVIVTLLVVLLFYQQKLYDDQVLNSPDQKDLIQVEIGNIVIEAEIADTNEERVLGLSGRNMLEKNTGLLFIFDKSDTYGFWMKDMRFPIDIIWIAEDFSIVHIEEYVEPETFPAIFRPQTPARYVLETNVGFVADNTIHVGDQATFQRSL